MGSRLASAVLLGVALLFGAEPSRASEAREAALAAFRQRHGAAWTLTSDDASGRPRRLAGGAIPLLAGGARDPATAVRGFLQDNASLLGLEQVGLLLVPEGVVEARGGRISHVAFELTHASVPIVGARASAALVEGNLVYVHVVGSDPIDVVDATPRVTAASALETAAASVSGIAPSGVEALAPPRLAFLRESSGDRLVWELWMADRDAPRRRFARVDALTGAMISLSDETIEACGPVTPAIARRVVGGVRPERADDIERRELLPFATAGTAAGRDGVFMATRPPYDGLLAGPAVVDTCTACTDPVQPLAPADAHGDADFGFDGLDEAGNGLSTPADRTAYFHAEAVRRLASRWQSIPWMNTRANVNVNVAGSCNASFDGRAINFFRGSAACANTGEIRDVVAHEWGHALDHHDGTPIFPVTQDVASSEGAADILAMLRSRDSCIGESLHLDGSGPSDTCSGVRDLDEFAPGHVFGSPATLTTANAPSLCPSSAFYRGPLGREGHCEGGLFGQAAWHLAQDLLTGRAYGSGAALGSPALSEDAAWDVAERLYHDSRAMTASYAPARFQALGPSAYDAYLVADDEGDGLANGTPHAAAIHDAFAHHGMEEPGLPPDAPDCVAPADPVVTVTAMPDDATGLPSIRVAWTDAGAARHHVLRADDPGEAFLPLASAGPGAGVVVDRGVLPRRTYLYRVVAEDASGCLSPGVPASATCTLPFLRITSVRIDDPAPGGNGDGRLEDGETASVFVDLGNAGSADARALSVSLSAIEPSLVVTGPASMSYGTIAPGGTVAAPGAFQLRVDPGAPPQAFLVASAESPDGCLRDAWTIDLLSRQVVLDSWRIEDPGPGGDADGRWEAGETVSLVAMLANTGLLDAATIAATLSFDGPPPAGVTIVDADATWPDLPAGSGGVDSIAPHFSLRAAAGVPPRTRVPLVLSVTVGGRPHATLNLRPTVNAFPTPSLEWSGTTDSWSTPLVLPMEDTDGDGAVTACDVPAIVVLGEDAAGELGLFAWRGDGSGLIWSVVTIDGCTLDTATCSLPQAALAGGDLDGDGTNEVVMSGTSGQVTAFDSRGGILWTQPDVLVTGSTAPQIVDLAADGMPEVIVGGSVLDAATGEEQWRTPFAVTGRVLVADLDLGGRPEFITASANGDAFRHDGTRYPGFFRNFDKFGIAVNLDDEPFPEIVTVHGTTIRVRSHEADIVAERTDIPWALSPSPPSAGNLDDDPMAEILLVTDDGLLALDDDLSTIWDVPFPETTGMLGGCSLFDFDGDGELEIVYRHDSGLAILAGRDGEILWETPCSSPTLWEIPVVADVDADGSAEIVVTYTRVGPGSPPPALHVFGHPDWVPARGIWNQEAYTVSNVEDDGGIPRLPRQRWTTENDYRAQSSPEPCPCGLPEPTFEYQIPDCASTTACFRALLTGGDLEDLWWDFGDGTPAERGESRCHEFAAPGGYAVRLVAGTDAGCPVEWGRVVELATDLEVVFDAVVPCLGEETCVDSDVIGGVPPFERLFDWGDGSPLEEGETLCHEWATGGTRIVTVFVRDASGCLAQHSEIVGIADPANIPETSPAGGQPLLVRKGDPDGLDLTFEDNGLDAGVYKGFLRAFRLLGYTHALAPGACGLRGGTANISVPIQDSYILVVSAACDPRSEGPYGFDSFGGPIPSSDDLGLPSCP